MTVPIEGDSPPAGTTGIVIHTPHRFDLIVAAMFLGRERAFREKLADLAQLAHGQSVLDVGCGTGTLAIVAKRHVGEAGTVCGIDASPEMIARARQKARRAGVNAAFDTGLAEAPPFPDDTFDVVLATFLLRHLPPDARAKPVRQMCRVARPGGRLLLVDTRPKPDQAGKGGRKPLDLYDSVPEIEGAGFRVETGAVGTRSLHFIRATAPDRTGQVR